MTALAHTHFSPAAAPAFSTPAVIEETSSAPVMRRMLMAGLGAATIMAALGVWAVPVDAGDTAMRLVKLVFSAAMLLMGMVFFSALGQRHPEPEIHLDPKARRLRIVEIGPGGAARVTGEYDLDSLAAISARRGRLVARDAAGKPVFAVPVRTAAAQRAICAELGLPV